MSSLFRELIVHHVTDLGKFRRREGDQFRQPSAARLQKGLFIKGPIPRCWLGPVLQTGGRTALALSLWFEAGLTKSQTVRLTGKLRGRFHLQRRSVSRALRVLEHLGLVTVCRRAGRCPEVTIVEPGNDDAHVAPSDKRAS